MKAPKKMIRALGLPVLALGLGLIAGAPALSQTCPFEATSAAAMLIDAASGQVVYSQNPQRRMQPASLAKIMTLFLIFDSLAGGEAALEDAVPVGKTAAQKEGSTMYLSEGEVTQLVELIKGIAIVSANDACVAAAEKLAGSERAFVDRMNRKLEDLGLQDTRFQTVDGWPAVDQYTSAYDMAMLSRAFIQAHPQALFYHRMKEFAHADIVLHNRNRLILQDPSVDGLKTGHVEEAGYHLIATAERQGRRYIAVVMGAENDEVREKEALQLIDFGFGYFTSVRLFEKGAVLTQVSVLNGVKEKVDLTAMEDGVVMIPADRKDDLSYEIEAGGEREAPIGAEQILGKVHVTYRKEPFKTIPLAALEAIGRKDAKTLAAESFKSFVHRQRYLLLAMLVLVVVILVQMVHITRLRRQIRNADRAGSEIVKQRLEKILK